mgnify:CR=1 FL=1
MVKTIWYKNRLPNDLLEDLAMHLNSAKELLGLEHEINKLTHLLIVN